MEFYELIEKIIEAIPSGYENVRLILETVLPWILGFFAIATCFAGHFVHKIWNAFFFFWIGFLIPVFVIGFPLKAQGAGLNALIIFGIVCGVLCAYFSKKLHKMRLFVTSFLMVFITLPSYLKFLGSALSVITAFAVGTAAGILSAKYKYIMTIITTAFSGSFMFFSVIEAHSGISHFAACAMAVFMALGGLAVQCFVEREELKESLEQLREKRKKVKKFSDRVKEKEVL